MILLLWLCLSLSILGTSCKTKHDVILVPIDTNIQRIIETKDFDSLLTLYFNALGEKRALEIKLKLCEEK